MDRQRRGVDYEDVLSAWIAPVEGKWCMGRSEMPVLPSGRSAVLRQGRGRAVGEGCMTYATSQEPRHGPAALSFLR